MAESFTQKAIETTLILGKGAFSEGGNTRIIEGLATEVSVTKPGLPEKNTASVRISGLSYDAAAQLTTLAFRPMESLNNQIIIRAGDKGETLSLVFSGEISSASADFESAPDVSMQFEASTGVYAQQIAEPALTVNGEAKASDLFSKFAQTIGYSFINNGLTTSVANIWLPGSPMNKAIKLARDIGVDLFVDDNKMIVSPAGLARQGKAVLLSKDTGLIGSPTFNQDGISCRCFFNPDLAYGGLIQIDSIVPKAKGVWKINKLTHNISAEIAGGLWESQIEALRYD